MKAKLKVLLPGFTGNMDDVVIYYNAKLNKYIARRKVMPSFVPSNRDMKEIFALARRIKLSEGYHADCDEYIRRFNQKNRRQGRALSTWPNVFLKLMRAQKKANPRLDYNVLTREDIVAQGLPCRSIATAVDAGWLEQVPGYQELDKPI